MRHLISFVSVFTLFSAQSFAGNAKKEAKEHTKAADAPAKFIKGLLTDSKGMTLYTFDNDTANSGKSACNEGCIQAWPALSAAADAKNSGDFTVVVRNDGSKQWAFKGKPLYTWVQDKKPGDTTGDKFKNIWHVVKEK